MTEPTKVERAERLREAFHLGPERGRRGVLLIHGFTGTPFEMRPLGEALASAHPDWVIIGPQLAGHCVDGFFKGTKALAQTTWHDWYDSVERAFEDLRQRCTHVSVCGLSLGGLLTLELARRHSGKILSVAVMATALNLDARAEKFAQFVGRNAFLRTLALPKLAGPDVSDVAMRKLNVLAQGSSRMPLKSLSSLVDFGLYMRERLHEITVPALIAHARHDHTIPFSSMEHLVSKIGTPRDQLETLVLEKSFHDVTIDVERDLLFSRVLASLEMHRPPDM